MRASISRLNASLEHIHQDINDCELYVCEKEVKKKIINVIQPWNKPENIAIVAQAVK